ncbi:hypothetical protein [Sphingobium sp. TomTYG45]
MNDIDISDYSVGYTLREMPGLSGQFKAMEPMRKFCGRFEAGTVALQSWLARSRLSCSATQTALPSFPEVGLFACQAI